MPNLTFAAARVRTIMAGYEVDAAAIARSQEAIQPLRWRARSIRAQAETTNAVDTLAQAAQQAVVSLHC